jgi:hypothetical protein
MRLAVLIFVLLTSSGTWSQTSAQTATFDLRIVSAFLEDECGQVNFGNSVCRQALHLRVEDSQHSLELVSSRGKPPFTLLALGVYKARLVKDEHSKPFLSSRVYELLYPDGSTERFDVVGEFTFTPESRQTSR